jgi:hypothetical protein
LAEGLSISAAGAGAGHRWPASDLILLLILMLLIGVVVIPAKGVSWDEEISRNNGLVNYAYVVHGDPALLSHDDRDYGVVFELPLVALEKMLGLEHYHSIYLLRHYLTFSLFLLSLAFLFKLLSDLGLSRPLCLLGVILLFLSPRIFAQAMYNSKDIPFLSVYIIGYYQALRSLRAPSLRNFILLGMASAVLINLRIMGVLLPLSFALVVLLQPLFQATSSWSYRDRGLGLLALGLSTSITLYACWPYLWSDPFVHFSEAFANMAQFRWQGNLLFEGETILATQIPWYYSSKWIAITTPVLQLLAGLAGMLLAAQLVLDRLINKSLDSQCLFFILIAGGLVGPLVAVLIFDSVLYDGWRHLYFVYPPLIIFATYALDRLARVLGEKTVLTSCGLFLAYLAWQMLQLYPFNQVYFNELVSHEEQYLVQHYEGDYYGNGYYQAFVTLTKEHPDQKIKVAVASWPGILNYSFLPAHVANRLELVPAQQASYLIDNFRVFTGGSYSPAQPGDIDIKRQGSSLYRIEKL